MVPPRNKGMVLSNPKFSNSQFGSESVEQLKRKKLRREMIFGAKQQGNMPNLQYFAKMQREDIQNMYRNLKITNNITTEENTRLKTKLQQIQAELN